MCDGHPAKVHGVNLVGLRRAKFDQDVINALKKAFKILFFENRSFDNASKLVRENISKVEEVEELLQFISSSKRGIGK